MDRIQSIDGLAPLSAATHPQWAGTRPKAPYIGAVVTAAQGLLELAVSARALGEEGPEWYASYDQRLGAMRATAEATLDGRYSLAVAFDTCADRSALAPTVVALDVVQRAGSGRLRAHLSVFELVAVPVPPTYLHDDQGAWLGRVVSTAHLSFGLGAEPEPESVGAGFMCSGPERSLAVVSRLVARLRATRRDESVWRSVTRGTADVRWLPIQALHLPGSGSEGGTR